MSKQRIRWIVALMAVGLLGLIGFQLYWINNAMHLRQEQFNYKVTDALQEVVRTLERQEILYQTNQRVHAQQKQQSLLAIGKGGAARKPDVYPIHKTPHTGLTLAQQTHRPTKPMRQSSQIPSAVVSVSDVLHPVTQPLTPEQALVVAQFLQQQDALMAIGDWQTQLEQQQLFEQWIDGVLTQQLQQLNQSQASVQDSAPSKQTRRVNRIRQRDKATVMAQASQKEAGNRLIDSLPTPPNGKTEEQSRMIKDVLKGLLLSDRPVEERVNRQMLDTLLRQALAERSISIPFEYGVRTARPAMSKSGGFQSSTGKLQFLFASSGAEPARFTEGGFKAALFPNNILETGNYVYLYFPDQQQYILSRMTTTLAGSAVLILVILACFYVAISTIIQQKKLADIKNDFINNMTHEFKTPISTISLAVEMAQEQMGTGTAEPSRLSRYMGIIRDETRRLGSHVEKVLQMALLDRGEVKLNLSAVNVHDVIEKVLNNIGLQIEQRQGEVDLSFEAENELVEADEVHLTNIIYNLVDNAIKYSPDRPHISISTADVAAVNEGQPNALGPGVSITVADHGLGLTKEQMSRIFEKFYRVPTGNRHDVKGFGLGLSYVKKMVDEHHGQIRVESRPGEGSSFDVILPNIISE